MSVDGQAVVEMSDELRLDAVLESVVLLVSMIVAVVVQRNAVEFEERVGNLVTGRRKTTVEGNTRHLLGTADIDTLTLFHVTEVDSINAATGMGDDWRLHVSDKSPLRRAEEWMHLDIRGAGSGTQSSVFVLDQQLTDKRLAETMPG